MSRVPVQKCVEANGIQIAVWEWPGEEPAVLFCHATGFHGRIWDQVIAYLPGRRSIAFDVRGHGHSSKPAPPYAWRDFGRDIAALAEALEISRAVGVGHSLGGHSITLGAAWLPKAFSALVLLDPVIHPQNDYCGPWKDAAFARKRRNEWTSADEMFERFHNRPPFDTWDRRVLRDYCDHALLPNGSGYILACPPDVEASIYINNSAIESNIYPEVAAVRIPVHVVRAGRNDPAHPLSESLTAADLAATFAHGVDTCLPEHSHFIPMEAPRLAAKFVLDALTLL
jgi:lipase